MGTVFRSAANLSEDDPERELCSLADVLDGALSEIDVDSVDVVREVRRNE